VIIATAVAIKIPFVLYRRLPLTSLGDANNAPTLIVIPICKASSLIPTNMGIVKARPIKIALEKSELLKNSERSLKMVERMEFS